MIPCPAVNVPKPRMIGTEAALNRSSCVSSQRNQKIANDYARAPSAGRIMNTVEALSRNQYAGKAIA